MIKCCVHCARPYQSSSGPQKRCDECRTLTCQHCKGRFISPQAHIQKFCSLACNALAHIETLHANRGTKPRTYHLRHRDRHGAAADREWRSAVFRRDDYTCQLCGMRGVRLEADHLKPYKAYPALRHDLNNGRTLCVPCHRKTETYGWSLYWQTRRRNEIAAKRLSQSVMFSAEVA